MKGQAILLKLIHLPLSNGSKFNSISCSNDLISFLNQSSEFNNLKYEKPWEFVYKEKFYQKFKKIDDNMPKILLTLSRDPELNEKNKIRNKSNKDITW